MFLFPSVVGLGHATTSEFATAFLSFLSKSIVSVDATAIVLSNTTVWCYAKCTASSIWCWRWFYATAGSSWISVSAELYTQPKRLSATIKCIHIPTPQSISSKFTKFPPTTRLFGLWLSTSRSIRWTIVSAIEQYGTVLLTNARSHQRCSTIQGLCALSSSNPIAILIIIVIAYIQQN